MLTYADAGTTSTSSQQCALMLVYLLLMDQAIRALMLSADSNAEGTSCTSCNSAATAQLVHQLPAMSPDAGSHQDCGLIV
jgi:hypothetical protein